MPLLHCFHSVSNASYLFKMSKKKVLDFCAIQEIQEKVQKSNNLMSQVSSISQKGSKLLPPSGKMDICQVLFN